MLVKPVLRPFSSPYTGFLCESLQHVSLYAKSCQNEFMQTVRIPAKQCRSAKLEIFMDICGKAGQWPEHPVRGVRRPVDRSFTRLSCRRPEKKSFDAHALKTLNLIVQRFAQGPRGARSRLRSLFLFSIIIFKYLNIFKRARE